MYVNQNKYCGHLRATLIISKCHLLINFANSLDLDQEFFKNLIWKKKSETIKNSRKIYFFAGSRVKWLFVITRISNEVQSITLKNTQFH